MMILMKIGRVLTAPHCIHTDIDVHTIIVWIVRRKLSYVLVAIMKAATALMVCLQTLYYHSANALFPSNNIMYRNEDLVCSTIRC